MELLIWNIVLSFISAIIIWVIKAHADEVKRIQILLNRTREEHLDKFVTKADMHNDINRVLVRLDRLDEKLDAYMKEQRNALS
jgi:hypothetical protein